MAKDKQPQPVRIIATMNADPKYSEVWEESDGNARWYERGRLVRNFGNAKHWIKQAQEVKWLVTLARGVE